MEPKLNPGTYVFATLASGEAVDIDDVIALMREPEGISVVVEEQRAKAIGLQPVMQCAWITLTVNSDLEAVGLTAAFASALGTAGISCNVVAGTNHDHIFVPYKQAAAAMNQLRSLQENSALGGEH